MTKPSPGSWLTIDEWADKHPLFRDNVAQSLKIMASELKPQDRETILRRVMIYARQEFDSK